MEEISPKLYGKGTSINFWALSSKVLADGGEALAMHLCSGCGGPGRCEPRAGRRPPSLSSSAVGRTGVIQRELEARPTQGRWSRKGQVCLCQQVPWMQGLLPYLLSQASGHLWFGGLHEVCPGRVGPPWLWSGNP